MRRPIIGQRMASWVIAMLLLAGCWRGATPQPVQSAPVEPAVWPKAREPMACEETGFDPGNPTCRDTCLPGAPEDWPGCLAVTDKLIAQGYRCTTKYWRSCSPPPPVAYVCPASGCVPFKARVIGLYVTGTGLELTIGAGANHGVTMRWRATMADAAGQAVPGGALTLVRVDSHITKGTIQWTAGQVQANPIVLLEP
jgi:hypothetical protein